MDSEEPKHPDMVQIRAEWVGADDLAVIFSNVFAVQNIKSEFVLTFGVGVPPIVTGPLTQEQANQITMKLKPVVRIGITPERLVELIGALQSQLRAYSQMELKS
jgi:hypothetical protein